MENQGHSGTQETQRKLKNSSIPLKQSFSFKKLLREDPFIKVCPFIKIDLMISNFIDEVIKSKKKFYLPEDLPKGILNLSEFKGYYSLDLFIHLKGGRSIESFNNFDSTTTFSNTEEFYALYRAITKSKNKIFKNFTYKHLPINSDGHFFLGKTFDLKEHKVIVLIGQIGFLPPTEEEMSFFYETMDILSPFFETALHRNRIKTKFKIIGQTIEHLPTSVSVIDPYGELFFNNRGNEFLDEKSIDNSCSIEINNGFKVLIGRPINIEDMASDILHSQRISLLGELLNTLKHELSNPLFGIKLIGTIMKKDASNNEIKAIVEEICKNCERCQNIIQDISFLYDGKIEAKKIEMNKFIQEILTISKSETRDIKKTVIWENIKEKNYTLKTNPTWLGQILFNLIINSGQAMSRNENKSKEIIISLTECKEDNCLKISLTDNGPGINPNDISKIFTPFYTTRSEGTGLGLAICQTLGKKLNAKISCHNNLTNNGATFSISHPLC